MHQISELQNENWKTNGELFVCLAQTPAPNLQQIIDGQPHPDTSTFLRSLLKDSPGEDNRSRLELMAPLGEHKAVVLIPEFAISMDGWEAVDGYVRSMQRAAIVIGGIGLVNGPRLLEWRNGDQENRALSEDHTQATFNNENNVFNAASCWTHIPGGDTKCTIFFKNFLEQRHEARIPGIQRGRSLVRIDTRDLYIYPAICADLTSQQDDDDNPPATRIIADTDGLPRNKNVLLAGMSYEVKPSHDFWANGIARVVKAANRSAILLIVNNALDPCVTDEGTDRWRCLTGAYVSSQQQQTQANQELLRSIGDREFSGVLSRIGTPFAKAGLVSWNFGGGGIRDIYRATSFSLSDNGGILRNPISATKYSIEVERFIRRYSPQNLCTADNCDLYTSDDCQHRLGGFFHKHINPNCQSQSVKNKFDAMNLVRGHIVGAGESNAKLLIERLCHGICASGKSGQVDPDKLHENRPLLERGIQVLGALALQDEIVWNPEASLKGHLETPTIRVLELVWIDNMRSCREIETLLDKWGRSGEPIDRLLVLCEGSSGAFSQANKLLSIGRGDITQASYDQGDIMSPRLKRVWIMPLGEIENFWVERDMRGHVERLLEGPLSELSRR